MSRVVEEVVVDDVVDDGVGDELANGEAGFHLVPNGRRADGVADHVSHQLDVSLQQYLSMNIDKFDQDMQSTFLLLGSSSVVALLPKPHH